MAYQTKILIVDDEIPVCKSISNALEGKGYAIDMALSGEEALNKEEENKYDIIIADLMMPGISGMELLKVVRNKRSDIMVIMVTGYPSIKSAVESIKLGAFDFIPKPFTPQELRSLVSRALESKHYHKKKVGEEKKLIVKAKFSISKDLYCIADNSWAKVEQDGNVRIGIHHIFLKVIEKITSIEFPKENEMRYQGEACLGITDTNKHIHRVWTPVSGKVIAINNEIKNDYEKLLNDPYKDGWMLLITPIHLQDDLKNLVHIENT